MVLNPPDSPSLEQYGSLGEWDIVSTFILSSGFTKTINSRDFKFKAYSADLQISLLYLLQNVGEIVAQTVPTYSNIFLDSATFNFQHVQIFNIV